MGVVGAYPVAVVEVDGLRCKFSFGNNGSPLRIFRHRDGAMLTGRGEETETGKRSSPDVVLPFW